jgi:hypothetical protein
MSGVGTSDASWCRQHLIGLGAILSSPTVSNSRLFTVGVLPWREKMLASSAKFHH